MQGLSNREVEVYEMIGQGLTIQQIAVRLHLSPKTVETHREKIKQKLNLKSSAELNRRAVQWVLERGWTSTATERPATRLIARGFVTLPPGEGRASVPIHRALLTT